MRRWVRVVLAAALVLQPVAWGFAQGGVERITDIRVSGLQRVPESRVLGTIRLRRGDVFSYKAVDEDVRRLDATGLFDPTAIRVRREPFQDGVRLVFELRERPRIRKLTFTGNRAFSDGELRKCIGLKDGDTLDVARERESTSRIEELYREKRYRFVKVERTQTLDAPGNAADVTFTVSEGPRIRIKDIRFEGNKVFTREQLLQQVEVRTQRWIILDEVFDESIFRMDVVRLRHYYKRNGYLDASVAGIYDYSPDKTELTLVFRIIEGTPYTVGDVTLRGQTLATAPVLMNDFRLKRNEPFNVDDYQHDLTSLRGWYTRRGYLDVDIVPKEVFPESGRIDLVYEIAEREPSRLGLLEVRGNFRTKDKVVRREFDLYPGDVFDETKVQKAVRRLWGLRYFRNVETTLVDGEEPGEKNLIVEVEEGSTGQVMFGVGVSSNDGLIGLFQIDLLNFDLCDWPTSFRDLIDGNAFVGAGQRLSLQLRPGTEYTQARLYFADPYIFDTHFQFSSDLFLWARERDDYDEEHIGVKLGLGRRITDDLTLKLTFRAERVDIDQIDTLAPDVLAVAGKSDIRSFILDAAYDRTDNPVNPSSGYRLNGEVEVAGDWLGGDWNFWRAVVGGSWYHTLRESRDGRKHVLALGGRVGVVQDYGSSTMVPTFERFYAGGFNNVRGFGYRGLGPTQLGTEVGGEFSVVGTAEYQFPLYQSVIEGRPYELIRGVVFCDVGQVAYTTSDIGDTKLRVSIGAGLRFTLPAFGGVPIALDFGFPIVKDNDDDTQVFSFSMRTGLY
ncbi:MAG TPA: outer membrane protein assembly factor BamA [Planctomycetota bacterium]|nr:outer membrane protein assembly factor BamA [Planctomycetota bacterium]